MAELTEHQAHSHEAEGHDGSVEIQGVVAARPAESTHLCHHGCDCWQRGFERYLTASPRRSPEQLDNAEAHALVVARNRAARDLRRRKDEMDRLRRRVIGRYGEAQGAYHRFRRFVEDDPVGRARQQRDEDARQRAEAGAKRAPLWLRVLLWPTMIAVGTFDTWYFMQVFQEINTGNAHVSGLEQIVSAAPGLALAVSLVVAGSSLGGPFWRWRREHDRRQRERQGAARYFAAVLPWSLRLALPVLLVLVAGAWGLVRAREAALAQPSLPVGLVAVLIMTLSVCAISIKVAAHDPYAEGEGASRRRLLLARVRMHWCQRRAQSRASALTAAWSDLCALRDELVARVRERYGEAYEFMMYARGFHGKAGPVPPPFAHPSGVVREDASLSELTRPEFIRVDQPEPEFGPLWEVHRTISRCDPRPLYEGLAELMAGSPRSEPRSETDPTDA